MLFVGWKKHVLSGVEGHSVSTEKRCCVVDTRLRLIHPTRCLTVNCDIAISNQMKILITGATGYLGSHLAHALVAAGYSVAVLKRKSSSLVRLEGVLPQLRLFDIEDGLEKPFQVSGHIDVVIHMATCYGRNGEGDAAIFEANTAFPLRLLEVAASFKTAVFINTDTSLDKYLNAYALSKKQFMEWGKFYAERNKLSFFSLRLEHFYGPGDDDSKFTSHVIKSCVNNVPELKLTPGEQLRDFIYIDDATSAYLLLIEKLGQMNERFVEFDVGSGQAVTIRAFVEMIHRLTGSRSRLEFGAVPYRDGEVMYSNADTAFLKGMGWYCQVSLEQGIVNTMEGYAQ